jgi:hypothetical protein
LPKTASILSKSDWLESFGKTLESLSEAQGIDGGTIGRNIDDVPGAGRRRQADWSRWTSGKRVPTPFLLGKLSKILNIPEPVLRVAAGYVDDILETSQSAAHLERWPDDLNILVSPRRAAFALLFGLFPGKDMYVGRRYSLSWFVFGNIIRPNTTNEGFLTGSSWNAAWLYPEHITPDNLIEYSGPYTRVAGDEGPINTSPSYKAQAVAQVDIASPAAAAILSLEREPIPKESMLWEAQHILHAATIPISLRTKLAAKIIHAWAEAVDLSLAQDVREKLHPWVQRTITREASDWVRAGSPGKPPKRFWF